MARQESLNNIPESELEEVVADFESEGAEVTKTQNPDGTWNVTAIWN